VPKIFKLTLALLCVVAITAIASCKAQEPAPQPIAVAPVMPAPQPQVPPPPPTPLVPVLQEVAAPPQPSSSAGKATGGGANVDAKIQGPTTSGEELIGQYSCSLDSKKVNLPLGVKLPPFNCRIYQAADGTLKLGPTAQGMASVTGNISDPKAAGFHVVGKATFAGQTMNIKMRMVRKGADTFSGSGKGSMNDDKKSDVTYTLSMTKQ
jgi:hypothetical protein